MERDLRRKFPHLAPLNNELTEFDGYFTVHDSKMITPRLQKLFYVCNGMQMQRFQMFVHTRSLPKPQSKKFPPIAYATCMLVIPVSTFCLGTWQVSRRKWKLALMEELQQKTSAPPVELPHSMEEISSLEYCTVQVRGEFDHSKEMYIRPRSRISSEEESKSGLRPPNPSGAWVVTPFVLSDREWTILVNRGWVPRNKIHPETRLAGQISGEIKLEGIVRLEEKRMPFEVKDSCHGGQHERHWFRRDIPRMAQMANCDPVFIDAVSDSTVRGGPIGGQTRIQLRNEHFSYILTWYSLSAATAYLWFKRFVRGAPLV